MTEKQIFDALTAAGLSPAGAAGLMGNLYAESGLRANNLQNGFEKRLGMNDEQYTAAVDNGSYDGFVHDSAGYGLAQWTYWSRKEALLRFAKDRGASIGDAAMQVAFMLQELKGYGGALWGTLKTTDDVRAASDVVLLQYEKPANQSDAVKLQRFGYGAAIYGKYAGTKKPETVQNGPESGTKTAKIGTAAVDFGTKKSNPRKEKISKITIHHMAGNMGAVACAKMHLTGSRKASANYYIGSDGTICAGVPENRRAWTSSSEWNDDRAITIEVANNGGAPDWPIADAALKSLVALCVDICIRYGIKGVNYDGTKNAVLTEHRMFTATECPGPAIHNLLANGKLPAMINDALGLPGTESVITTAAEGIEPAQSRDTALAGAYIVTAPNGLRLRAGAGTNKTVLTVLKKGERAQNYGYYTEVDGVKWLYVIGGGKKGFCSSEFLKKN